MTDTQWERVRPLLPPQKPATGRPAKDHRIVVDAILWHRSSGRPWRELPERYGPWQSIYTRLRRWQAAGIWDRVLAALYIEPEFEADKQRTLHVVAGVTAATGARPAAAVPVTAARSSSQSSRGTSRWSAW